MFAGTDKKHKSQGRETTFVQEADRLVGPRLDTVGAVPCQQACQRLVPGVAQRTKSHQQPTRDSAPRQPCSCRSPFRARGALIRAHCLGSAVARNAALPAKTLLLCPLAATPDSPSCAFRCGIAPSAMQRHRGALRLFVLLVSTEGSKPILLLIISWRFLFSLVSTSSAFWSPSCP